MRVLFLRLRVGRFSKKNSEVLDMKVLFAVIIVTALSGASTAYSQEIDLTEGRDSVFQIEAEGNFRHFFCSHCVCQLFP